jgi:hypothetical protein
MFERADHEHHPDGLGLDRHVLSYRWDDFVPHLAFYNKTTAQLGEIPLDRLAMAVGDGKHCVGQFDDDGYHPCPQGRRVDGFAICKQCVSPWIPVQKCVFEPQCNGERCNNPEFCRRKHYVYLAFFGNLVKVGMTSIGRLRERAIEQGADAVRPLFECLDRREARDLEKETSRRFKIPQEIRIKRIASQWTSSPSRESMINIHDHYLGRIAKWREPFDADLTFLDAYPIDELPRTAPEVTRTSGLHRGEVVGVKGRYLMFRPEKRRDVRLLDLSDLPSRSVRLLD